MQRGQAFDSGEGSATGCIGCIDFVGAFLQTGLCQSSVAYSSGHKCRTHRCSDRSFGRSQSEEPSGWTAEKAAIQSYHRIPAMTRGTKQPGAGEALRPQRTTVILFRQPSTPISTDAYLKSFEAACLSPQCIGVLEQALVDIDSLTRVIDKGPDSWAGVIATSTRSGEAWVAGAKLSTKSQAGTIDWSTIPLYVPGISTAEPFERSGLPAHLVPTLDSAIRHSPPGSASRLAEFIITHTSASDRPFLFLTGDKTLPELPDRLREAGRKLTLHQVYKTGERPGLRGDLRKRFEHDTGNQWLAFFAPSSAQMVLDHLDDLGVALPRSKTLGSTLRLAAIGQTTTTYLENRGLVVHATAEHPTPAGLLNAIQHAEK